MGTHLFLSIFSSMPASMGLLLHWTSWLFEGSLCIEYEGCRFSALRDLKVTIASTLDFILREAHPMADSDTPAILEGVCGSFSGEFHSRTGSKPPATCYCISTTPSWVKWLRTSRWMFPNYFGMTKLGPHFVLNYCPEVWQREYYVYLW